VAGAFLFGITGFTFAGAEASNLMSEQRIFPAKLLLFGEHVLLLGAPALAVPVHAFGGTWAWGNQPDRHHARMLKFARSSNLVSTETIDHEQFAQDLERGLFFSSNIPTGYGLGSSGALCAAVYARYARYEAIEDLSALKSVFAQMESFFHGSSSGIDPLTSYLGKPILIQNKGAVQPVEEKPWTTNKPIVFLLDSRLPRRTEPLVEWFLAQNKTAFFKQKLTAEYLPVHRATLDAWLAADDDLFWANLRRVSRFQLEHFSPMVPATVRVFWEQNVNNADCCLKICGAGGGGFVLGFARDASMLKQVAEQFELVLPF